MSRRAFFLSLLLCASQSPADYEEERQFIEGLTEAGFPNLAGKVLFRTLEKYPEAEAEEPELRIRILIAGKKFEEAANQISNVRAPESLPALFISPSEFGLHAKDGPWIQV